LGGLVQGARKADEDGDGDGKWLTASFTELVDDSGKSSGDVSRLHTAQ
jgi:hypothetical protein